MNQCRKVRQGAHYTDGENKSQRYFGARAPALNVARDRGFVLTGAVQNPYHEHIFKVFSTDAAAPPVASTPYNSEPNTRHDWAVTPKKFAVYRPLADFWRRGVVSRGFHRLEHLSGI
jgi:hypothetical protein